MILFMIIIDWEWFLYFTLCVPTQERGNEEKLKNYFIHRWTQMNANVKTTLDFSLRSFAFICGLILFLSIYAYVA